MSIGGGGRAASTAWTMLLNSQPISTRVAQVKLFNSMAIPFFIREASAILVRALNASIIRAIDN
jgi:hypothetical protein